MFLQGHFQKLSGTKIKRKKRLEPVKPELLIKRHAGVLGLSACVQAFPYNVPEFIPQVLMDLSDHLDDPQPIQVRAMFILLSVDCLERGWRIRVCTSPENRHHFLWHNFCRSKQCHTVCIYQ